MLKMDMKASVIAGDSKSVLNRSAQRMKKMGGIMEDMMVDCDSKIPRGKHPKSRSKKVKMFRCSQCSYSTTCSSNLSKHKYKHAAMKAHACAVAGCMFRTRYPNNMRHHMRSHSDRRDWVCAECTQCFKTRSALQNHSLIHSDDKPLTCPVCPFRCKRPWELTSHRLIHVDHRPFSCTQCMHRAKTRSDLTKHARVHASSAERVVCPQCARSFPHSMSLTKHIRYMHTERARVSCESCTQTFKHPAGLRRHVLTVHSRMRPFRCDVCNHTFSTRHNMVSHMRVHAADRTYNCPQCPYAAYELWHLYAHVGSAHPGTRMHYCELCRREFGHSSQLAQHMRTRKHKANMRFTLPPVDAEIEPRTQDSTYVKVEQQNNADVIAEVKPCLCEAAIKQELSEISSDACAVGSVTAVKTEPEWRDG